MNETYRPGYEMVAERLLAYIAEQGLQPGDRLPTEKGLAEILGTGRSVTREAIKILAAVGRVAVRKGAGIYVSVPSNPQADSQVGYFKPTDLAHVAMLFDHRRLVEAESARLASNLARPAQVQAIRAAADASVTAAADQAQFRVHDREFHDAVAEASGNVFLQAAVSSLRDFKEQSDRLLFAGSLPGSLEVAAQQHVHIAEAIAAGDADKAGTAMVQHVDTTQAQFEQRILDRLKAPPQ
ncbi:MAG TPA: FadR/GntR family transcriptional regulator [Kribbella sp.]|uniref:FadR/GntR family transcriptional regulator n=1 Tax=Kribbella sp. TaxID=1871183 RepID=UPI002D776CBE|nr:FadR/GntR family transcriptional regulator [Kribbella sp.]HET6292003.1 FadR/GntR family transcriptional regulator [Kribbella sp.]